MTKSQLVEAVASRLDKVSKKDIETIVDLMFNTMSEELAGRGRVEIRGFGSFTVRVREAREGRNPKTGAKVSVPRKVVPFFQVGKELKERVNAGR